MLLKLAVRLKLRTNSFTASYKDKHGLSLFQHQPLEDFGTATDVRIANRNEQEYTANQHTVTTNTSIYWFILFQMMWLRVSTRNSVIFRPVRYTKINNYSFDLMLRYE